MAEKEIRFMKGAKCELRSLDDPDNTTPKIIGTAVVFNTRSEPMWDFREVIMPSAFDETDMADVRGLFNHDPNYILGRTASGTLTLRKDAEGLGYEIDPPSNDTIKHLVLEPIKRRDITGSSFAFSDVVDDWVKENEDGKTLVIRYIHKIGRLYDVSPVTYPAYPDTQAAQRSLEAWKQSLDDKVHLKAVHQRSYRERILSLINPN